MSTVTSLDGELRTAERLLQEVATARRTGQVLLITGNVDDILLHPAHGPLRLVPFLDAEAHEHSATITSWSPGRCRAGAEPDVVAEEVERLVEQALAEGTTLVIDFADHALPAAPHAVDLSPEALRLAEVVQRAAQDPRAPLEPRSLIVLVDRGGSVHRDLRQRAGVRRAVVGLPDAPTLAATLELLANRALSDPDRYAPLDAELAVGDDARSLLGLRADDLVRESRAARAQDAQLSVPHLLSAKQRVLRQVGCGALRIVDDEDWGFDRVAGLDHLRDFVAEIRTSGVSPAGFVLAGPPGIGKSHVVRAIGHELRRIVVELRPMTSPFIGENESRLEDAFAQLDAFSPCVLWIDEINKVFPASAGGASATSGTQERLEGLFLERTGTRSADAGVMVVGTANEVQHLNPAIRDRFPVVPVLHPGPGSRVAYLQRISEGLGIALDTGIDFEEVAALPSLACASGREMSDLLQTAARWSAVDHGSGAAITPDVLREVLAPRPTHGAVDRRTEVAALAAVLLCRDPALLPWRSRHVVRLAEVPPYLSPYVDGEGRLDRDGVEQHLAEMGVFLP